jgi:hypothetical protein
MHPVQLNRRALSCDESLVSSARYSIIILKIEMEIREANSGTRLAINIGASMLSRLFKKMNAGSIAREVLL